jgi:hypothetical protein
MKLFRKLLRYWIAFASIISFMVGWVILAHSPKPVQAATVQPSVTLPSLPPIQAYSNDGSNNGNGLNFFSNSAPANPQPSTGIPRLRTRGS